MILVVLVSRVGDGVLWRIGRLRGKHVAIFSDLLRIWGWGRPSRGGRELLLLMVNGRVRRHGAMRVGKPPVPAPPATVGSAAAAAAAAAHVPHLSLATQPCIVPNGPREYASSRKRKCAVRDKRQSAPVAIGGTRQGGTRRLYRG